MMFSKGAAYQREWPRSLAGDSRGVRTFLPAAILSATFLAYVATLDFAFVSDDQTLIITNDAIRSWRYLPSYFASHIWGFQYPQLLTNAYRPILLIWLRLNDALFGLRPWGWHLSLVLAHVAVTYLVYRLALRLTGDTWSAGAGALIFGLHPVHVETIAQASWADQPISTLFMLATVLTWWQSRRAERKAAWLAASMALFATALLSKESSLMLPILISGWVWIDSGAGEGESAAGRKSASVPARLRRAFGAALPYWLVVLVYLPLRMWALKGFAHVATPLSLSKELFTIPSVLTFYLRLLIWPVGLSCYYDTPYVSAPGWRDFALPAALLAGVAAALFFWHRFTCRQARDEAKAIEFACLWMVLTLLPVLNFGFLSEGEIAHDRYLYLPSVGFAILAAIALRQGLRRTPRFFHRPAWALLAAFIATAAMGFASVRQSLYWSDNLVLSVHAHDIAPHNVTAITSLAAAIGARGMDGQAMALYQQALAIQPDFWPANRNLGFLYYNHGDFAQAARCFARSLAAGSADGDEYLYMGLSLLQTGHTDLAERAVRAALVARPKGTNYHLGLGMVLQAEGRLAEAKHELGIELAEDPRNARAKSLLEGINRQMQPQAGGAAADKPSKGLAPNIR